MKTTSKAGLSASMQALRELDRMVGIGRKGLSLSRAISIPQVHRVQLPAHLWLAATKLLANQRFRVDGSGSGIRDQLSRNEEGRRSAAASILSQASALNRSTTMGVGSVAMTGRLVDSRNAVRAISAGSHPVIRTAITNAEASKRARETLERGRAALAETKTRTDASSIRGMTPPPNLTQREFANPIRSVRGLGASNRGININSSPTVVINATAAGSSLQRDVLSALRTHRDEMFDQLKRESARRERAQF